MPTYTIADLLRDEGPVQVEPPDSTVVKVAAATRPSFAGEESPSGEILSTISKLIARAYPTVDQVNGFFLALQVEATRCGYFGAAGDYATFLQDHAMQTHFGSLLFQFLDFAKKRGLITLILDFLWQLDAEEYKRAFPQAQ